jgi:hypothetical protein
MLPLLFMSVLAVRSITGTTIELASFTTMLFLLINCHHAPDVREPLPDDEAAAEPVGQLV